MNKVDEINDHLTRIEYKKTYERLTCTVCNKNGSKAVFYGYVDKKNGLFCHVQCLKKCPSSSIDNKQNYFNPASFEEKNKKWINNNLASLTLLDSCTKNGITFFFCKICIKVAFSD